MASVVENFSQLATVLGLTDNEEEILGLELHDKIIRNDLMGCVKLIKQGARLNESSRFNNTISSPVTKRLISQEMRILPLHVACIYRRPEVVALLLKHGADPNMRDYLGRVPLQLVLTYWPRIPFTKDYQGLSTEENAYHKHLNKQHKKAQQSMNELCAHGAQCNASIGVVCCVGGSTQASETKYQSLLHLAAKFNIADSVRVLLRHGVDVNVKDGSGRTAVIIASQSGNFQMMHELIGHGANVNVSDSFGMTPLHWLCTTDKTKHCDNINRLLQAGASCEGHDHNVDTPLHMACGLGKESAMHVLLRHGANPDGVNHAGRTPLFLLLDSHQNAACTYGMEILCQSTLNINVIDHKGNIPELLLQHPEWTHLRDTLMEASTNPPSLVRMCRVRIRRAMGHRRLNSTHIAALPCAPALKKIVLYNMTDIFQM